MSALRQTTLSWQDTLRTATKGLKSVADAAAAMRTLAEIYPLVEVEALKADDYKLLFPYDGIIGRGMHSSPNLAYDVTGGHWHKDAWNDPAFLAANDALGAAEDQLKDRLRRFAIAATRAFLDDPTWHDMMWAEARLRNMSDEQFKAALAKARRDATSGIASGWVWVRADDLLTFYRHLDRWRDAAGKLSPVEEAAPCSAS